MLFTHGREEIVLCFVYRQANQLAGNRETVDKTMKCYIIFDGSKFSIDGENRVDFDVSKSMEDFMTSVNEGVPAVAEADTRKIGWWAGAAKRPYLNIKGQFDPSSEPRFVELACMLDDLNYDTLQLWQKWGLR